MPREDPLYKLQKKKVGRHDQYFNYFLTVPIELAELIPEGALFQCEEVEDGILYRFMGVA